MRTRSGIIARCKVRPHRFARRCGDGRIARPGPRFFRAPWRPACPSSAAVSGPLQKGRWEAALTWAACRPRQSDSAGQPPLGAWSAGQTRSTARRWACGPSIGSARFSATTSGSGSARRKETSAGSTKGALAETSGRTADGTRGHGPGFDQGPPLHFHSSWDHGSGDFRRTHSQIGILPEHLPRPVPKSTGNAPHNLRIGNPATAGIGSTKRFRRRLLPQAFLQWQRESPVPGKSELRARRST